MFSLLSRSRAVGSVRRHSPLFFSSVSSVAPSARLILLSRHYSGPNAIRSSISVGRRFSSDGAAVADDDADLPPPVKLRRVSDAVVDRLLADVRHCSDEVISALRTSRATPSAMKQAESARRSLDNLFMVVVVGEFNAGKSTVLNALLGHRYLEEGVTPTTKDIGVLRYGDEERHEEPIDDSGVRSVFVPVDWLRDIAVVDTPGTNAVMRGHQALTEKFIPRADLVLFVTSCDRAFSESERQFLTLIRSWHKKVVVVLQKRDLMANAAQLKEVEDFVRQNMRVLLFGGNSDPEAAEAEQQRAAEAAFGDDAADSPSKPNVDDEELLIFPVSAKKALANKRGSGFSRLQSCILEKLDGKARARLKLLSPLGVADRLLEAQLDVTRARSHAIEADEQTLATIDRRLERFQEDMKSDFELHRTGIDSILLDVQRRARDFADDQLRLSNVLALAKPDELQRKFVDQVAGHFVQDIERLISDSIDWMVREHSKQWLQMSELVEQRRAGRNLGQEGNLSASSAAAAVTDRESLLLSIGQGAQSVLSQWDREAEASRLTDSLRSAIVATAAVEVGAVGFASVFAASLLDVTGLLGGLVAAGGLAVLPFRRRQFQKALDQRLGVLRERLRNALTSHFDSDLKRGVREMNDRISVYRNFVEDELADVERAQSVLGKAVTQVIDVREKVDSELTKPKK